MSQQGSISLDKLEVEQYLSYQNNRCLSRSCRTTIISSQSIWVSNLGFRTLSLDSLWANGYKFGQIYKIVTPK